MIALKIFNIILCLIVGIIVLKSKKILKLEYFLVWSLLEMILVFDLFV